MPATSVTTTMDNLNAVTNRHYVTDIVKDSWLVDAPTYRLLYERRQILDGGTVIAFPVRYARNDFQFYTAFEQFRTTMIQTKTEGRFDWRLGAAPVTIDDFTIKRNGSDSIVKLAEQALIEAKEDFINAMAWNLFDIVGTETSVALPANLGGNVYADSGASSRFEGLQMAIRADNGSNTYGGIGTSANTWWRSYVSSGTSGNDQGTSGTARALTIDIIRTALTNINKGGSKAEFCVMDQDAFDRLDSLLFGQRDFISSDKADLGFEHIEYRGCVFYPDPYMQETKNPATPAQSTLLFYNTDLFFMVAHRDDDMDWGGWMRPVDQKVFTGQISIMGNYCTVNRLRLGRINNITAP